MYLYSYLVGVVMMSDLTAKLISGHVLPSDPATKALAKKFKQVSDIIIIEGGRVSNRASGEHRYERNVTST